MSDMVADVVVIGAGPSGAIASALLVRKGYKVLVLERETFPRFSIGESLLPHCMQFVEEAGMMDAVKEGDFQFKNGAAFIYKDQYTEFDFTQKFSDGPGTTFQVQRAKFDKVLADSAAKQGADIRYKHTITAVDVSGARPRVSYTDNQGNAHTIETKETTGWIPYPIPDDVLLTTRMHLSLEQVKELIPFLQAWVDNGSFKQ